MGLRDQNPLIDTDLALIIDTFETTMNKSRDIDSVLVPFRREIGALKGYPESIINAVDGVPIPSEVDSNERKANQTQDISGNSRGERSGQTGVVSISPDTATRSIETLTYDSAGNKIVYPQPTIQESVGNTYDVPAVDTPEVLVGDPNTPLEDGDDDEEFTEKMKNWVADCVPCYGEFKRTLSTMDADFFKDIGEGWDSALSKVWDRLKDFDDLLKDSDVSLPFCDLGNLLKAHCGPDLEKIIFILTMFLGRMELDLKIDLSILDSFLMELLSPIFNELASNLDMIATLAISPLHCVLDQIQYQINRSAQLVEANKAAVVAEVQNKQIQIGNIVSEESIRLGGKTRDQSEAEQAAKRARQDELIRQRKQERSQRGSEDTLNKINKAIERTKVSIDFAEKLRDYLTISIEWLEEKKDWLLNLIQELVGSHLDKWDMRMKFSRGKTDILILISIIKALIEAAKSGDFSCGPETGSMTEADVARISDYWEHPSESLEIIIEDGNIVTRRLPSDLSYEDVARSDFRIMNETVETDGVVETRSRLVQTEGSTRVIIGTDSIGGTDSLGKDDTSGQPGSLEQAQQVDRFFPNIVSRRPISSCLKKITSDEADEISRWIRQLEQEV
jgi:hypothetical protein